MKKTTLEDIIRNIPNKTKDEVIKILNEGREYGGNPYIALGNAKQKNTQPN